MGIILELFLTFAKIGLFTFGGGYAMISMIENACVEQKKWINHISLMLIAAVLGLTTFLLNEAKKKKGGAKR